MSTYINCQNNHQTTLFKCLTKHKAKRETRKIKGSKEKEGIEPSAYQEIENEGLVQELDKENLDLVMENNDWAASSALLFSPDANNKTLDSANS